MKEKFVNRQKERNFTTQTCRKNITYYSMYFVMKASVVERVNRKLKNDVWKQFMHNRNYINRWIDLISRLMSEYNERKHRIIGIRSIDIILSIIDELLTIYKSHKDRSIRATQNK